LFAKYKDQGLEILGFPCNQFLYQMGDIETCALKFNADFPHFAQINVNGGEAFPLFKFLKAKLGIESISWNFEKFLCDRDGVPFKHYGMRVTPDKLEDDIKTLLTRPAGTPAAATPAAPTPAKV